MSELITHHSHFPSKPEGLGDRKWHQAGVPRLPHGSFQTPTSTGLSNWHVHWQCSGFRISGPTCLRSPGLHRRVLFLSANARTFRSRWLGRREPRENTSGDGTQSNLHSSAENQSPWSPRPGGLTNTCPLVPNGTHAGLLLIPPLEFPSAWLWAHC